MSDWVCSQCKAEVDDGFDICWQCGVTSDGTIASDFVPEIDVATLPANHVRTIECDSCGYRGKILIGRCQFKPWVFIATPVAILSVFGMIPLFIWLRFAEMLRFKLCANCRDAERIHDWHGDITPENESIWADAQANEEQCFARSRFRFLCLVLATLLFAAALMVTAGMLNS